MTKSKILSVLKSGTDMTANAIATALGMNKANTALKNLLTDMISNGEITFNDSGRYIVYNIVKSVKAKTTTRTSETVATKHTLTTEEEMKLPDGEALTDLPVRNVHGYEIRILKDKIQIKTPNGKVVNLSIGQSILIINDRPEYVVSSSEDVMLAVNDYANKKGWRTFVVSDLARNEPVKGTSDVKFTSDPILLMSIKAHNKAA